MWSGRLFPILIVFSWVRNVPADTVVDVSKEWNERSGNPVGSVQQSTAPAKVLLEPSATAACECESLTPQERLEGSTYAFIGTVAELGAIKKGKRTAVFDIDEIFKGSPKPELKVTTEISESDCDLAFEIGQSYLVFARWEWGTVITSRCMGTKLLAKAKTAALGPSEELKEKLYIRLHNACMGRRDTSCCLSSLKTMSAGYYVPEPEAGCPDGTKPDRLLCGGSFTWCIPVTEKDHRQPER